MLYPIIHPRSELGEETMKLSRLLAFGCAFSVAAVLTTTALGQDAKAVKRESAGDSVAHSVQVGTTLENLQSAFYAESNETALYREFGKKADEEGYHQVASMFRAVARAEEIHATSKADLIRQMSGIPKADADSMTVLSTRENLDFAMASETYEKDVMYPEFVKQARKEKNQAAVRIFSLNMAAEPGHHAMFEQTLADLEGYRGENVQLLICPVCGRTVRAMREAKCPVCSTPKEKFEKVK
jgi:rubrerythrin